MTHTPAAPVRRGSRARRFFSLLGVTLAVLVLAYLAIQPALARWGATASEVSQTMPGDLPGKRWTRAITIDAAPEAIYTWLLQWGQGRGGWYSYDWLENLLGFDIHSATDIRPELQNLAVGDPICMAPNACPSNVTLIEPPTWLAWQAKDPAGKPMWSYTIHVAPRPEGGSRLLMRESFDPAGMPPAVVAIIEIPDVVMAQKSLETLKLRAEGRTAGWWVTPVEIGAWLAAFGAAAAGAVLYMRRGSGAALRLVAAAVLALVALTFLFLPLWLRAALVIALLAAVVWEARKA